MGNHALFCFNLESYMKNELNEAIGNIFASKIDKLTAIKLFNYKIQENEVEA